MSISPHPRGLESIKVGKLLSEKRLLIQDPRHPSPVVADAPVLAGSLTTDRPSSCPHPRAIFGWQTAPVHLPSGPAVAADNLTGIHPLGRVIPNVSRQPMGCTEKPVAKDAVHRCPVQNRCRCSDWFLLNVSSESRDYQSIAHCGHWHSATTTKGMVRHVPRKRRGIKCCIISSIRVF